MSDIFGGALTGPTHYDLIQNNSVEQTFNNLLSDSGTGTSLIKSTNGELKKLKAGQGIALSQDASSVTITNGLNMDAVILDITNLQNDVLQLEDDVAANTFSAQQTSTIRAIDNNNTITRAITSSGWGRLNEVASVGTINNLNISNFSGSNAGIYLGPDDLNIYNSNATALDETKQAFRVNRRNNRPVMEIGMQDRGPLDTAIRVKMPNVSIDDTNASTNAFMLTGDASMVLRNSTYSHIFQVEGSTSRTKARSIYGFDDNILHQDLKKINDGIIIANDYVNSSQKPEINMTPTRSLFIGNSLWDVNTLFLTDSIAMKMGPLPSAIEDTRNIINTIILSTSKHFEDDYINSVILDVSGDSTSNSILNEHPCGAASCVIGYKNSFLNGSGSSYLNVIGQYNRVDQHTATVSVMGNNNYLLSESTNSGLTNSVCIGSNNVLKRNSGFTDGYVCVGSNNNLGMFYGTSEHLYCFGSQNSLEASGPNDSGNGSHNKICCMGSGNVINSAGKWNICIGHDNTFFNSGQNLVRNAIILGSEWSGVDYFNNSLYLGCRNSGAAENYYIRLSHQLAFGSGNSLVYQSSDKSLRQLSSARRYKKEIKPIKAEMIDNFDKLRPVEYRYKEDPRKLNYGFIAEELEGTPYAEFVYYENATRTEKEYNEETKKWSYEEHEERSLPVSINYMAMIPLLFAKIQKLEKEINILKANNF